MEPKRSKYDTNPLDEKVGDHADQSFGSTPAEPSTAEVRGGPTRDIGRTANEAARRDAESEAPTRLIDDKLASSYPSVFVSPPPRQTPAYQPPPDPALNLYQPPPIPPPSVYQPPPMPLIAKQGGDKVAGLGIPERWAVILPYLPFYLAIIIAIVELLFVPRTETRVRFHASQALVIQLGITAVSTLLQFAGFISGRYAGAGLFSLGTSILLIIAMVRLWKGKPVVVPQLDEPRKWLDEKIKPRK